MELADGEGGAILSGDLMRCRHFGTVWRWWCRPAGQLVTVGLESVTTSEQCAQEYRWAAQDGPLKGLYRIFLYKIQPNQFHTVLLYNRGTEPHTMYWAAILGGPAGGLSGLSGGLTPWEKIPDKRFSVLLF